MPTLIRTLVVVAVLGGPAAAEVQPPPSPALLTSQVGSYRGVAQDYLVLPGGGELTSSLRFVTARDSLGDAPLRFTDLALFDVSGRWALARPNLEFSADVSLLPKQPSFTSEKPWQSVAFGVRTPLAPRIALGIAGAGGHLIAQQGVWTRQTAHVEWRKPLAPVVNLGLTGGVDVITLSAPKRSSAFVTEVTDRKSVV